MADYYTEFSFVIPLPADPAKRAELKAALAAWCEKHEQEVEPLGLAWGIEEDGEYPGIWCRHNEAGYGNVDDAVEFTQTALRLLGDPKAAVVIEWSNGCSKPRIDAYGGGACVVAAKRSRFMPTCVWADGLIKRWHLQRINPQ